MNERGLTLIELLITLSILAILIAIGVPSFQRQLDSSRTRTAADQLLQAIQLARAKAVSTNRRATLRKLGDWQSGWEVFYDRDFDGVRDVDEAPIVTSGPLTGVRVSTTQPVNNYVSFIGSGESRYAGTLSNGGFQAGTFTICPLTGNDANEGSGGYELRLARGGRVRTRSITAAECLAANQ